MELDCRFGAVPLKVMVETNWTADLFSEKSTPLSDLSLKAYSAWALVGILIGDTKYDGNLIRDLFLEDLHWICLYYLIPDRYW